MVLGECRLPTSFWTTSTGRAPWGQIGLPTMSFGGLGVQATSAEQD